MTLSKIEERTLYPSIVNFLNEIGFSAYGESTVTSKHPDIIFSLESKKFVIEIKIGKSDIGSKAVAQAYDYAQRLGTNNIIILVYPNEIRKQTILDSDTITDIALDMEIHTITLTDYLIESKKTTPKALFLKLRNLLELDQIKIDFDTIVGLIGAYVKDLNQVIQQIKTDYIITEVVDKLDLFSSIGEFKNEDMAKRQILNLAAYLLFNQVLFYHIYHQKTKVTQEITEITEIKDLQSYIDQITKIDYQSIYKVNLIGHIPNKKTIIQILNDIIKSVKLLRAEHVSHDLAGRFFHDLIPFEVRKILAAFYTHPNAADLLARLTIDSFNEKAIDPACGSGTLLVSTYNLKMDYYKKLYGFKDIDSIHKQFIENDLTGIDIMPFASHLTAINLSMQNVEMQTNVLRIATLDTLELADVVKTRTFSTKGIKVTPYTTSIQLTLDEISSGVRKTTKRGSVSAEGQGTEFHIKKVDSVIMNPPFTDREKMPAYIRDKLNKNSLGEICGHQINLWGYFIALSSFLISEGGKIGAVIPINIARGKATSKIRNYILDNLKIRCIVKTLSDIAFSEGASFRDILFILEKEKPKNDDDVKLVFLKKSIRDIKPDEIEKIIDLIKSNDNFTNDDIIISSIKQRELVQNRENFMRFLIPSLNYLASWLETISNSDKLTKIPKKEFPEGFHASPKGLSQLLFITNPFSEDRIKRAFMIKKSEDNEKIIAQIKGLEKDIIINKKSTYPAIRTITGLNKIEIDEYDHFIFTKYDDFDFVLDLSKWDKNNDLDWIKQREKAEKCLTYFVIPERFNPYSKNTHLLGFMSNVRIVTPHTNRVGYTYNIDEAKCQCIFFNSTIFLAQFFMNKEETSGQYLHIMESDLVLMKYLNLGKLDDKDKSQLLELYEKIKKVELPSLYDQLLTRFWVREEIDRTLLLILGFEETEINKWLPKIYNALIEEFNIMRETKT